MTSRVKETRKGKGIKQETMAQKINIGLTSYQRYENGLRIPNVYVAQKIANALNETVAYLFPLPSETTT